MPLRPTRPVYIRIDEEVHDRLNEIAQQSDRSVAKVVNILLANAVGLPDIVPPLVVYESDTTS